MTSVSRVRLLLGTVLCALIPGIAAAQSTIAGTVRDTSGAILPGVTVEASSDVLIEKTRSVVTDSDGRYAIIDLRPGTYDVTFTLPGFSSLKREAVIVPANVSVPINADLKVGSLEETITVTGASPVVDVQNTSKVQVMTRELMDTIPSARNIQSVGSLVPGVRLNTPDVGGAQQTEQTYMATHGNSATHNTVLLDSMPAQTNLNDGAVQNYIDNALVAEAVYKTSGVSAETSAGGVFLNLIPKDGGNSIHGQGYFAGSADSWHLQSHNVDDDLLNRNLSPTGTRNRSPERLQLLDGRPGREGQAVVFRVGPASGHLRPDSEHLSGGRIVGCGRCVDPQLRGARHVPGDSEEQVRVHLSAEFQVEGARNRVRRPDRAADLPGCLRHQARPGPYYIAQGKWTSTVTSKLLVEAGYSGDILHYSNYTQDGIAQERNTPAWFAKASHLDTLTNGLLARTNAGQSDQLITPDQHSIMASLSYVTGSHNIKTGMLYGFGNNNYQSTMNARPLAELHRRHARQRRLYRGAADYGHGVQYAARPQSAVEGERRPLRAGPVVARQIHAERRHPVGVPVGSARTPSTAPPDASRPRPTTTRSTATRCRA